MVLDDLIFGNEDSVEEAYDEDNYQEEEYGIDGPMIQKIIMDKYFALSINEMKQAVKKYKSEYGDDDMGNPLYEETVSEVLIKDTKMRADIAQDGMRMSMVMDINDPVVKMIR